MHTFVCEGAWFLQQQGLTSFPQSRSLFLIGIPLGVFCGILSIQESLLGLPKTWRASHSLIHANVVNKQSLTSAVSIYDAFGLHTVSFRMPFSFIIPSPLFSFFFLHVITDKLSNLSKPRLITRLLYSQTSRLHYFNTIPLIKGYVETCRTKPKNLQILSPLNARKGIDKD